MIITSTVATRVKVRVIMVSFHRPVAKMTASQTAATSMGRSPPSTKANPSSTGAISHQGEFGHQVLQGVEEAVADDVLERLGVGVDRGRRRGW